MSSNTLIVLLAVFCLLMFGLVGWLYMRQRSALKTNQARIAGLQDMLKKQYQHRVESIGVIASAMMDKQCEYTKGCIRLKQLVEQVEPEILAQDEYKVIELMYSETEHMPIKEQWTQLDKTAKQKFTQQRFKLEAQHEVAIHAAAVALKQRQFAGYQNLS